MRNSIIYLFITTIAFTILLSCNNKTSSSQGNSDSIAFDSIKIDSTLYLTKDTTGPRCHIKLCLTYIKGKNAKVINDSLIRSGILSPDYLSLSDEQITISEALDSFVNKYFTDYKEFYGDLYKADLNNRESYNCEYILNTNIIQDNPNYYTYMANVYRYMGGAHGSSVIIARNIDVKTGKIVVLKDILVPGYKKNLIEAINNKLYKINKVNDLKELMSKTTIFDGIEPYISDNFIIGGKSITFIYSPDEIACHAVGEIKVEVSNDDIKELFKK